VNILPLFFENDEFCQRFEPIWNKHLLARNCKKRNRRRSLALSEVMTILILFHQSGYRNLKQFYLQFVCRYLQAEFPKLVRYNRFVEFERDALVPLAAYLQTKRGRCAGISFIDSTELAVRENLRIPQHRRFTGMAQRGKTTSGWFYGFKLHLIVSDGGRTFKLAGDARQHRRSAPGSEAGTPTFRQTVRRSRLFIRVFENRAA
jgi:hypothetical protein